MTYSRTGQVRRFGAGTVTYMKPSERGFAEGGHLVEFPDGRSVFVGPDDVTSGYGRSLAIKRALEAVDDLDRSTSVSPLPGRFIDPAAYLIGVLTVAGAKSVQVREAGE